MYMLIIFSIFMCKGAEWIHHNSANKHRRRPS